MAVLRVVKGPNVGQVFEVRAASVVLGRSPDCAIVLDHAAVSRLHAKIECVDGSFYIEDLKSRNGVRINGQTSVRHQLRDNDLIKICGYHLSFEDERFREAEESSVDVDSADAPSGTSAETARGMQDDTQSE